MSVSWKPPIKIVMQQLIALSCCSIAKLYSMGLALELIDPSKIKKDSFYYYVKSQKWRKEATSHHKRKQIKDSITPDLSGCRLNSDARIQFSVRLIPISFYRRESKQEISSPDGKKISTKQFDHNPTYGVLGVAQELCSGLLRAELLMDDAPNKEDIYSLSESKLIDFVAKSITLPALKCAAVHFPKINLHDLFDPKAAGLFAAWLGAPQPCDSKSALDVAFKDFYDKVLKKAIWGPISHKIKPDVSIFHMDFPQQQKSTLLDLTRPCGKGWAIHTLNRQLRERLDRHNTHVDPNATDMNPTIKLWMARLCYARRVGEISNEKTMALEAIKLEALMRKISYRERIPPSDIRCLQDVGIKHLKDFRFTDHNVQFTGAERWKAQVETKLAGDNQPREKDKTSPV